MAKMVTPFMTEQVFNPGGAHGAYICQWLENVVGDPGLLAILLLTALIFLTYLTSETIILIRKLINPIGYISKKETFTITNLTIQQRNHMKRNKTRPYLMIRLLRL